MLVNERWSYLSEGTMHESRTRLCCWCCLALARGLRRVVMTWITQEVNQEVVIYPLLFMYYF